MSFNIPDNYLTGFNSYAELSDSDVSKLLKILSDIPVGIGPTEFDKVISHELPEIYTSDFASSIFSIGSLLYNIKETKADISKILAAAIIEEFEPNLSSEDIEDKFLRLLKAGENLKLTMKAADLITNNNLTYSEAQLFSDIRMLFSDDNSNNSIKLNQQAVLIHNLKINCYKDGRLTETHISLDSFDLMKMKNLIDRAIEKETQIIASNNNIDFIKLSD